MTLSKVQIENLSKGSFFRGTWCISK